MEYAIVQTGGKQYKVTPGMVLELENLKKDSGEVEFNDVLLHVNDGSVQIGMPVVNDLAVFAKILGTKKGKKIRVSQYRAKARQRRALGHRKIITTVEIVSINKKAAPLRKKH